MTDAHPSDDPQPPRVTRRHRRAARDRARALSPLRFALRLLAVPGLTLVVALSLYVRTSPHEPEAAIRHLIARTGCDSARSVGLATARRGELGYHARNDADGDGVACNGTPVEVAGAEPARVATTRTDAGGSATRYVGGAKFVRP